MKVLTPWVLAVLAEHQNIFQCQINLLEIVADNILPEAAWSTTRLLPVCRWLVELVDDQASKHDTEQWCGGSSAGLSPSGHKIRPVHYLDSPEAMNLKVFLRGHILVLYNSIERSKFVAWCVRRCCDATMVVSRISCSSLLPFSI